MAITAAEQYLLELINRARLDPAAEAKRYGVSLNSGLSGGTIDTSAKQVLAPNSQLERAAINHSNWMLNRDIFSHTGANGSTPGDRMENAGYNFTGSWTWRENLAWSGSTGDINMARAIRDHHEGLYRSAGHRANTFAEDIREIGIAQVEGRFTYQGNTFNASMLTENFAASGRDVFVTGVVYRDRDRDDFYDIGEGRGNYWFRGGGDSDRSAGSGGYALEVGNRDEVYVKVGIGDRTLSRLDIDTSDGNVKLDLVLNANGQKELLLSSSADLLSGVRNATLLGVEDLNLSGTSQNNRLVGNKGDNRINGEGKGDYLLGQAGNDVLKGGSGWDVLRGGTGRDILHGGSERDELHGGDGNDNLNGNRHADWLYGNDGRDRLVGGLGDDLLRGGAGNDVLRGERGADELHGGTGDDQLSGNRQNDRLYGNDGRDRLDGGVGNDVMTGGRGVDTFVFCAGDDRITDFQNNIDTIAIDRDLGSSRSEILNDARVVNGNTILHFDDGHSLKIMGVTNIDILANDLILI